MAKKKGTDGQPQQQTENEQKQQAVLLADSFNNNFRPISYELPKVMCPLVNIPMINYTLELLASNGVEEVFVFCVNKADTLSKYLSESFQNSSLDVKCVTSSNCSSAGDALREIDQMGVIRSDPFVLVYGDVVSNINLRNVINIHKEAKSKDSSKIMTMCFSRVGPSSALRPILNDLIVGINHYSRQIVLFADNLSRKKVSLPIESLHDHSQIEIHSDLLDCFIDICSPEVLVQISDNFDYQDLRQHFVSNEVENIELGNKIVAHIIDDTEYSARIDDFRLYDVVSRDIIRRWTFPLVPDNPSIADNETLTFFRGFIYRHRRLNLPRSITVGNGTVIGQGAIIGDNVVLDRCVIGKNVTIESGAVIKNSYLWERAKVGKHALVDGAILACNVEVGDDAHVPVGCILGEGVKVGRGIQLAKFSRFTQILPHDEDDGWDEMQNSTDNQPRRSSFTVEVRVSSDRSEPLGQDGIGRMWSDFQDESNQEWESEASDVGEKNNLDGVDRHRCRSIGCTLEQDWRNNRWNSFEYEEPANDRANNGSDIDVFDEPLSVEVRQPPSVSFDKVIRDMLVTGDAEGHSIENILLEIKGFKFAQNRNFAECVRACIDTVLDLAGCGIEAESEGMELVGSIKKQLWKWGPLLTKLAQDSIDQLEIIRALEMRAEKQIDEGRPSITETQLGAVFRYVLQLLYDKELVSDATMLEWIKRRRADPEESAEFRLFNHPATQLFVEWLEEEDEEGDSVGS